MVEYLGEGKVISTEQLEREERSLSVRSIPALLDMVRKARFTTAIVAV